MTLTGKKMLKKWKSDSAMLLGKSCCSDILSDIEGFKKAVEERASLRFRPNNLGGEKKEHVILQEERASLRFRPNNLGREKKEHVILQIEEYAPQTQGVAAENSCGNSRPLRECESGSGIMFYAVVLILVVAEVIIFSHLVFF